MPNGRNVPASPLESVSREEWRCASRDSAIVRITFDTVERLSTVDIDHADGFIVRDVGNVRRARILRYGDASDAGRELNDLQRVAEFVENE